MSATSDRDTGGAGATNPFALAVSSEMVFSTCRTSNGFGGSTGSASPWRLGEGLFAAVDEVEQAADFGEGERDKTPVGGWRAFRPGVPVGFRLLPA